MTTKPPKKRQYESLSTRASTSSKKQKSTLAQLPANHNKKYTKRELEDIERSRRLIYNFILDCARRKDMDTLLAFPHANQFEIPMARVPHTLEQQVELLDIYHYLQDRKEDLPIQLSHRSFERLIGVHLPKVSLERMLKREGELRAAAKTHPTGAYYIVDRENLMIEEVLYRWLQDQRKQNVPVNGKMIKKACTVLVDLQDGSGDTMSEAPPSFSASWFNDFKKRHGITYCQLHGEAGSVDLEAIEPELIDIRQLCAQYTPDNIFNCDETGFYLQELVDKSYTTPGSKSGAKANRSCRVSTLFCINASGSSLAMADTKDSLKPLVIGKSIPKDLEKDSAKRMLMRETNSGWMNRDLFVKWLQMFDDDLSQPTLLLLDSAGAHNNIDMRDSRTNTPWKHLHIRRLPTNTTSVTQPLDAGVISVFKRAFLEMLSYETYLVRSYGKKKRISDELAWTLIPYAWSRMKPLTLRNCFSKTPVPPTEMREQLRRRLPTHAGHQQPPLQYFRHNQYKEQERAYFEHLIAETTLADVDLDATIEILKYLAGDHDVLSVEGIKQLKQVTEQDLKERRGIRGIMKELVHTCAALKNKTQ